STAALAPAIDALRTLLQTQVLYPHGSTFWNSYKLVARSGRFPWASGTALPLDLKLLEGAEPWYLSCSVEGASAPIAQALLAQVREVLGRHVQDLQVVREEDLPEAERA